MIRSRFLTGFLLGAPLALTVAVTLVVTSVVPGIFNGSSLRGQVGGGQCTPVLGRHGSGVTQTARGLNYVAADDEGNLWTATDAQSSTPLQPGKIGKRILTNGEYGAPVYYNLPLTYYPYKLAAGADGDVWFAERNRFTHKVGRVSRTGVLTEYIVPREVQAMAVGSDGNLWFTQVQYPKVSRVTPAGVITEFDSGFSAGTVYDIVAGPDDKLWMVSGRGISRVTTSGAAEIVPNAGNADRIIVGPNGNLWAVNTVQNNPVQEITPAGGVTEHGTPSGIRDIAPGPDGNVWFTGYEQEAGWVVGFIPPVGEHVSYTLPVPPGATNGQMRPNTLIAAPDGNVWFGLDVYTYSNNYLGRVTPDGDIDYFDNVTQSGVGGVTQMANGADDNLYVADGGLIQVSFEDCGGASVQSSSSTSSAQSENWSSCTPQVGDFKFVGAKEIISGSDGNLWVTLPGSHSIGRISLPSGTVKEFPLASYIYPESIAESADGNFWFTHGATVPNTIGRVTPSGDVTYFNIPTDGAAANTIVAAPDGNLWVAEGFGGKIARVTPGGGFTEFPTEFSRVQGIAIGPDNNVWFVGQASQYVYRIVRITRTGSITAFPVPAGAVPSRIAAGPDGNLWITNSYHHEILRMTTAGEITQYSLPEGSKPVGITAGPDGNLWFTETGTRKIGRITTAGIVTEYAHPALRSDMSLYDIAAGPDGNLYFTDTQGYAIGRVTCSAVGSSSSSSNTGGEGGDSGGTPSLTTCAVRTAQHVRVDQCSDPYSSELCNVPYYKDVTFGKPFINVPKVLVTPNHVAALGGCARGAMDALVCRPENVTKTGFRIVCGGSPIGANCPNEGKWVPADANWIATEGGTSCTAQEGHQIQPQTCGGENVGGLCIEEFTKRITFSKPYATVPHVVTAPEHVSSQSGCVGGATDQLLCLPKNIDKTGFTLSCSGSPAGSCGAQEGWKTLADGGWIAMEGSLSCNVQSKHWLETTECPVAQSSNTCSQGMRKAVTFDTPFSAVPQVIISPELVTSGHSACAAGATDAVFCEAQNITKTGFTAVCWGSPKGTGCGPTTEDAMTSVRFGYLASDASCPVPAANDNGLIGYFPFEEGAGSITDDASVNSNTLTLLNNPQWVSCVAPTTFENKFAIRLDGIDDYLHRENPSGFSEVRSISAWFNLDHTLSPGGEEHGDLISLRNDADDSASGPGDFWSLELGDPTLAFSDETISLNAARQSTATNTRTRLKNTPITGGVWHHLAVVYNDAAGRYDAYFDGVLETNVISASNSSHPGFAPGHTPLLTDPTTILLGAWKSKNASTPRGVLNGIVDEMRLYSRSLTAAEIAVLSKNAGVTCGSSSSSSSSNADICLPICGDGLKVGAEQCDDGNVKNGDGCSGQCRTEASKSSSSQSSSARCPADTCQQGKFGGDFCAKNGTTCIIDNGSSTCFRCQNAVPCNDPAVCSAGGNQWCAGLPGGPKSCVFDATKPVCFNCQPGGSSSSSSSSACPAVPCSAEAKALCSAQGRTCVADSSAKPGCFRCDGDYTCEGNECGRGGSKYCESFGNQSCVNDTKSQICINCTPKCPANPCGGGGEAYCANFGKECKADSLAAACITCEPGPPIICTGTDFECENGGDEYCSGFGKICKPTADGVCIQCLGQGQCTGTDYECTKGGQDYCTAVGGGTCSGKSDGICIQCSNPGPYTCQGNECRKGGANYCATLGQRCKNIPGDLCIDCTSAACTSNLECAEGAQCTNGKCVQLCGNGRMDPGEVCDGGTGCTTGCLLAENQQCTRDTDCASVACRRGVCVPCTEGGQCQSNDCREGTCTNLCGNGKVDTGEICDPGLAGDAPGCTRDCLRAVGADCSDSRECQTGLCGSNGGKSSCIPCANNAQCGGGVCASGTCVNECGNGELNAFEQCDDGNFISGDGCDRFCRREASVAGELLPISLLGDVSQGGELQGIEGGARGIAGSHPAAGETGPAAVIAIAGGAAAGWSYMRRRRK